MTRTKLSVLLFVIAAALLPQAAFAAVSSMICADEAQPRTCILGPARLSAATLQPNSEALGATYPAADSMPVNSSALLIEMATPPQTGGTVVRRTPCPDDAVPQLCIVREPVVATAQSPHTEGTALGAGNVNPADTAGLVGIGQPHTAPARHTHPGDLPTGDSQQ